MNKSKTEKTPRQAFFQFTKQQLAVNVNKYDKVLASKNSVSLFNTQPIDPQKLQEKPVVFTRRLNSLDSAMLEDNAYKALDNNELKLEKRIENTETLIREINEKLIVAETIQDEKALKELFKQKKILLRNLENLKAEYTSQNIDTQLTAAITKILMFPKDLKSKINKKLKNFVRRSKLIKRYTPIVRSLLVRDTLGRLDKINKSVDELVKMKVPFGEQEQRYETLINHLSRAGALHAQILKELNN